MAPFLTTLSIHIRETLTTGKRIHSLTYMLAVQGVQAIIVLFLIFFSWKKGSSFWLKIGPYLIYGLAVIVYLIIPVGFVLTINQMYNYIQSSNHYLWIYASNIIQICHICSWFLLIHSKLIPEAKTYIA